MAIKLNEQQKMIYDDLSMPEKVAILLIQRTLRRYYFRIWRLTS